MDWIAVTAVSGLVAALGSLGVSFSARRKNDSDAAEAISKAAQGLLDPLNKQVDALTAQLNKALIRIVELEARDSAKTAQLNRQSNMLSQMRAGIQLLNTQLVALKQTPLYAPPNEEDFNSAMGGTSSD